MKLLLPISFSVLASASASNDQSPALRSANSIGYASGRDLASEGEREALSVCTGIERLLGATVECECVPEIMTGTLSFDCDTLRDVTIRQNIIYTPSFTGLFSVALLPMDVSFGVGYCLDGFTISIEEAPMPLNVGDVCFQGQVKLDSDLNSTTPLLTPTLESCTFTAGSFGVCEACEPCTTSSGQTGFSVTCDFVEVAACVPLAIPISRNSRRVSTELFGEQIADGMLKLAQPEIDRMISEAQAAATPQDEPDEALDGEEPVDEEGPVEEPDESEAIATEPVDVSNKKASKGKTPKMSKGVGDEEQEEDDEEEQPQNEGKPQDESETVEGEEEEETEDEPEESVLPDWGEPNTNTGKRSFWDRMWPF
ncbi:hypothetical protein FisN_2Lh605 [Fistulifera solaris]|uniref:Uncharacterized protein n=1 Tax=Fistulifera solaris TaxID=1519565 RepID=A0A1Z5JAP3_FISSO|nr:hypothetical protein FisN_2Lh605 [Fistulifera solaris]|eukprot:GAX11064.1 hypothetical protein FisN_2Lh605 [Fistulifera solaris]